MQRENQPGPGLPYAQGAFGIWGFMPVYVLQLKSVPAIEFVGWRILFTLPVCLLFVTIRWQGAELWQALCNPRVMGWLALTSTLTGGN